MGEVKVTDNVLIKSEKLSQDLEQRSLIFVLAQNHIEFFTSYVGFFRKGLVQMLLDSKISISLLKELIETYMPNYIFLPNSRKNDLKSYEVLGNLGNHKIFKLNKSNSYSLNKDLALLLSTSGSTGSKKFVRISYKNIYHNTKNIVNFLGINGSHRTITTMPPFYTYGLSVINTHLFTGASILVTNLKAIEKGFWKLMRDQKVSSFAGVPYFYEVLNKIKDGKGSFLSKIDRMNKIGGLSPKKQIPVDIFNDDPEPDDDPPAGGTSKKIPINNDKKTADLIANKKKIK